MVEIVKSISATVATCGEFTAVIVIVVGALQALGAMVRTLIEWKTEVSPLLVLLKFRRLVGPGSRVSIGCRHIANSNQSYVD